MRVAITQRSEGICHQWSLPLYQQRLLIPPSQLFETRPRPPAGRACLQLLGERAGLSKSNPSTASPELRPRAVSSLSHLGCLPHAQQSTWPRQARAFPSPSRTLTHTCLLLQRPPPPTLPRRCGFETPAPSRTLVPHLTPQRFLLPLSPAVLSVPRLPPMCLHISFECRSDSSMSRLNFFFQLEWEVA